MARRLPVLFVAVLAIAACSDDGADEDSTRPTVTTTTVAPTTSVELSIEGEGFLVVRRRDEIFFTPSARFTLDDDGKLATAAGDLLQGWPAGDDGDIDVNAPIEDLVAPAGFEIDEDGIVTSDDRAIGQITVTLFDHPGELEVLDGGLRRPTVGSGLAALSTVGVAGRGAVLVGTGDEPAAIPLSIEGEGFLLVRRGGEIFFTRAATFTVDDLGKLVTSDGDILQGWPADDRGDIDANQAMADLVVSGEIEIDAEGLITAGPRTIGQLTIGLFSNPVGLEALPNELFRPTATSGLSEISTADVGERGSVIVGAPRWTDLSIDGEGFLLVQLDSVHYFTRSATFTLDGDGRLTTPVGATLQGWSADADGVVDVTRDIADLVVPADLEPAIDADGVLAADLDGRTRTIGQLAIGAFDNPDGLEALDGGLYQVTSDSGLTALAPAGVDGRGSVIARGAPSP